MSGFSGSFAGAVSWENLRDAYGPASDLPNLLERVAAAKGRKLHRALQELSSHVLHQGTIYSASPPAAHVLLEMLLRARAPEKAALYAFLSEMADAAQLAIEEGPAAPSCAGGDPKDGAAIRLEFLDAAPLLARDLSHPDAQIRARTAAILTSLGDGAAATLVRTRYTAEADAEVRKVMLARLGRDSALLDHWPDFLSAALERETTAANRFLIRCAQVRELKSAADVACVAELVSSFVEGAGSEPSFEKLFYEAVHLLSDEREFAALLQAFEIAQDEDTLRELAESMLRIAFDDRRTGWGQTSYTRLREDGTRPPSSSLYSMALRTVGLWILYKLFPFAVRWVVRSRTRRRKSGVWKIDYWGLEGTAPAIPRELNHVQRRALTAFAAKPQLWRFRTNLWELFALPDNPAGLQRLLGV